MEWESPRHTQFEPAAPVMGGMRWGIDRRERSEDFCRLIGVPYRTFEAEELLPAPVEHVGPHFTTTPPEVARAGEEYVYQARAHDASVGGFTWSLRKNPSGMEIERYTGKITWSPAASCRVEVELLAVTHHGRMAKQTWTLSVGKPVTVRTVTPHPRFIEALRRKSLRAAHRSRLGTAIAAGRAPIAPQAWSVDAAAPANPGPEAGAPRISPNDAIPIPAFRRLWRNARGATPTHHPATAPPRRPPGAAVVPLRL